MSRHKEEQHEQGGFPLLCPNVGCKRAKPGKEFTRNEHRKRHMRSCKAGRRDGAGILHPPPAASTPVSVRSTSPVPVETSVDESLGATPSQQDERESLGAKERRLQKMQQRLQRHERKLEEDRRMIKIQERELELEAKERELEARERRLRERERSWQARQRLDRRAEAGSS